MTDSRLTKLGDFLESRNRLLRLEAISALAQITTIPQQISTWQQLFSIVTKYLESSIWEGRVASAELLSTLLSNADESFYLRLQSNEFYKKKDSLIECAVTIEKMNVEQLMKEYQVLVSCETKNITGSASHGLVKHQRHLVDLHLDMNSNTGVSSQSFITDEELLSASDGMNSYDSSCDTTKSLSITKKELYEEAVFPVFLDDFSNCVSFLRDVREFESKCGYVTDEEEQKLRSLQFITLFVDEFLRLTILPNLISPKWQARHGAAFALSKICAHPEIWLFSYPRLLSAVVTRLLQLLCLDRFCDFVTGSNAIAPVREAAAQALSNLLLRLDEKYEQNNVCDIQREIYTVKKRIASAILNNICNMLQMKNEQHWQCRQAALLLAKYHFAASTQLLVGDCELYNLSLYALEHDQVDEVISAASRALCSVFYAAEDFSYARQKAVPCVWRVLECKERLVQLVEGVDSVLEDLLGFIELWLRSDYWQNLDAQVSGSKLILIVELLDCSPRHCPVIRNELVMKCICSILERSSINQENYWTEQLFFELLKRLYRCVIFCQTSSTQTLLSYCQKTLLCLLKFAHPQQQIQSHDSESIISKVLGNKIALSIGLWMGCLIYNHTNPEIDVFLHNIDGSSSRNDASNEMMCSDELLFFEKDRIDTIVLERKAIAARWLAPLIDALFSWGSPIGQQPMFISVQLLFSPYLRSNSLYQKLGSALLAQSWAEYYQSKCTEASEIGYEDSAVTCNIGTPVILIKELEQQLISSLASIKLFDETNQLVNLLTRECNDFKQYCMRKGVPIDELLPLNQIASMEDAINSAYHSCEQYCSVRPDDHKALKARHSLIIDLIRDTKLGTRTYTSRINALFASAIISFSKTTSSVMQLTPLIRPLIETLETENSVFIVNFQLAETFCTLIEQTKGRIPCPHGKILRQLANGLIHCDSWAPKIAKWSGTEMRSRIISLEHFESDFSSDLTSKLCDNINEQMRLPCETKARNCSIILRKICEKFGLKLAENCPEMINGQICLLEKFKYAEHGKEESHVDEFLMQLDFLGNIFSSIADYKLRHSIITDRIGPIISDLITLLCHANPAVRFRVARFLADLTAVELCAMLKLIFQPLDELIAASASSLEWSKYGVTELLCRLSTWADKKLLGVISLLIPLSLRCIGDRDESIRKAASFACRNLITLLPLENKQKHFLRELSESTIKFAYLESFSLFDVLSCPSNLSKLTREDIPWLHDNLIIRDYQIEGITWLSFLNRFGLNGILADDMGLGKTFQVLALLAWDFCKRSSQGQQIKSEGLSMTSLIVCPRTLVDHWCKEWNSFFHAPRISLKKLPDLKERRHWVSNEVEEILVVSYEEVRSNKVLSEQHWHYVVLDEGHLIRNPNSQIFESVCSLKSSYRLILSGTPVQNSPADLWALFAFLMPGYLSSRTVFNSKYMRHILTCRNQFATEQQIKKGEEALKLLHRQCLPFVLRRLKSEVLTELPEKIIQDRICELTSIQRQLYELITSLCSLNAQNNNKRTDNIRWLTPLQVLQAMRKLIDHPFLIVKLVESFKSERPNLLQFNEPFVQMHLEQSGKMLALRELLAECQIGKTKTSVANVIKERSEIERNELSSIDQQPLASCFSEENCLSVAVDGITGDGSHGLEVLEQVCLNDAAPHRALIFCQWRATVELIATFLDQGAFGLGINYVRLDGCTPPSQRQSIVERFNTDMDLHLLLLTTHVGGIGLNLTGADVVIFVDHDWNPFRDLQAIDRAHRLGQRRTVHVFRLITEGTIEEKVMRLQQFKTETANALIGVENRSLTSMATDDLLELFSLSEPSNFKKTPNSSLIKRQKMSDPIILEKGSASWTVEDLWGEQKEEDIEIEEYKECHSVQKFVADQNN